YGACSSVRRKLFHTHILSLAISRHAMSVIRTVAVLATFLCLASSHAQLVAGHEIPVNTFTTGDQQWARVATGADGSYMIVWESDGQDGDGFGIYGRRYSAGGLGIEFPVNTTTAMNQQRPNIVKQGGGFAVTFGSAYAAGAASMFFQRLSNQGALVGGET